MLRSRGGLFLIFRMRQHAAGAPRGSWPRGPEELPHQPHLYVYPYVRGCLQTGRAGPPRGEPARRSRTHPSPNGQGRRRWSGSSQHARRPSMTRSRPRRRCYRGRKCPRPRRRPGPGRIRARCHSRLHSRHHWRSERRRPRNSRRTPTPLLAQVPAGAMVPAAVAPVGAVVVPATACTPTMVSRPVSVRKNSQSHASRWALPTRIPPRQPTRRWGPMLVASHPVIVLTSPVITARRNLPLSLAV